MSVATRNHRDTAGDILRRYRVGIFIVTHNAERFIDAVLQRVPSELRDLFAEIYIIDDSSTDNTVAAAVDAGKRLGYSNLVVLRAPFNGGYGGNQKLGYLHAIRQGLDFVLLLPGDGQYPPEYLPQMILAFGDGDVDAVIGSRMLHWLAALRGKMPVHRWVGNQVLTAIENLALGTRLSEFHSSFRAYRVRFLESIQFQLNSNDFHFDLEILIQLIAAKGRIRELAIPIVYSDESLHANGFWYAYQCLGSVAKYRLTQMGLFYQPNFDFQLFERTSYSFKQSANSLHQFVLNCHWDASAHIADLGANEGEISRALAEKVAAVTSVDLRPPARAGSAKPVGLDLNSDFDRILGERTFDCVLALDVIEHLTSPEEGVTRIGNILKPGGRLYASTGNVAFWALRLSLLAGQFNYGKRGILDLTHTRLFTIGSFKKLLATHGFQIEDIQFFGPPIVDMLGKNWLLRVLDALSGRVARYWPGLLAYSFLVIARRHDALEDVYQRTASSAIR